MQGSGLRYRYSYGALDPNGTKMAKPVRYQVLAVALRVAEASHPVEPYSSQRPTQGNRRLSKALGSLYIGEKYKIWDCKE